MKKGLEILFSKYIIDGTAMESTPADMLRECLLELEAPGIQPGTVVDERLDMDPSPLKYDISLIDTYLDAARGPAASPDRSVSLSHPYSSVRILIAEALLRFMWRRNGVKLDELALSLDVLWDSAPVGCMAAFHSAIESATGYVYELGLRISAFDYDEARGRHDMDFRVIGAHEYGEPVPASLADVPDSVLVYVPFDTCSHRLGGSLLSGILGKGDETAPEISDPDYFIDSFEVVHDLVEDGVVLSGVTVGRGGLLAAVDRILGGDWRIDLDISGIRRAYMEDDRVRVLFSEIPGALIQIPGGESAYVDSQLLLQDIAYYTLGSPERLSPAASGRGRSAGGSERRIALAESNRAELSRLLSALIGQPEDPDISNVSEGTENLGSE